MKQKDFNKRMKKRAQQHFVLERRSKEILEKTQKKGLTVY